MQFSDFDNDAYKRTSLLVNVSKLYYERGMSQSMVAEALHISRPYVSKLLAEAQSSGIVRIIINDPMAEESRIEKELRQRFELRRVICVPISNSDNTLQKVSLAAAHYLDSILKSGDTIGLGWGTTVYHCAKNMPQRDDLEKINVVNLTGLISGSAQNVYEAEGVKALAAALGGTPYTLPLPAIIENQKVKSSIYKEPPVAKALTLGAEANIALFTIGIFNQSAALPRTYMTEAQYARLKEKAPAGEVLSHYFDHRGNVCDGAFDKELVSLPLQQLKQKEYRIAVAIGRNKISGICGALLGGYVNVLITPEDIAYGIRENLDKMDLSAPA